MTRAATAKLGAYAGLAALGLLAALVLGRPELAALASPFALAVVAGLALAREPELRVWVAIDRERAIEGDEILVRLELEADETVPHLEARLEVPHGFALVEGQNPFALRLPALEARQLDFTLRCERWGGYRLGGLAFRARDPLSLFVWEWRREADAPLKVYPRGEALQALVRPLETQVFSGNQVAREKGDGIEFADVRPFVPGDRVRRVNWRASARRGELWVNEHHPERNADLVLFLDSFSELKPLEPREPLGGLRASTLDLALRAAVALADAYIRRRDRVGFVGFGGTLRWLQPGMGLVQLYRLVDALVESEITLSYAWKGIDILPARTLPPRSLVVALTPLLDERSVAALLDLRARGFDLAIVELSPEPFVEPGRDDLGDLGHRLWLMRRNALRARYERVGVPVVPWREGVSLAHVLEEVTVFRRHARPMRA